MTTMVSNIDTSLKKSASCVFHYIFKHVVFDLICDITVKFPRSRSDLHSATLPNNDMVVGTWEIVWVSTFSQTRRVAGVGIDPAG